MAVRRVRRIVRRIDPWTVLKVSLVFNAITALIFVLGTWVMWSLALRRGIPERVVDIFESLTLTITVEGELYFRIVVLLAIIGAILATAFMTLGAVLYNLIADLVGGVEIAVLEESYRPVAIRTRLTPLVEAAPAPGVQPPGAGALDGRERAAKRAAPRPAEDPDLETDSPVEMPIVTPREPAGRPVGAAEAVTGEATDDSDDTGTAEEADPRVRAG